MIPSSPQRPSLPSSDTPPASAEPHNTWRARAYSVVRFASLVILDSPPMMLGLLLGSMIFLILTPAGDPVLPHVAPATAVSS